MGLAQNEAKANRQGHMDKGAWAKANGQGQFSEGKRANKFGLRQMGQGRMGKGAWAKAHRQGHMDRDEKRQGQMSKGA